MPKQRKTRKQKIASAEKKQERIQYTYSTVNQIIENTQHPETKATESISSYFRYDTELIYKDLFKTGVISFILIVLLIGASLYL